MIEQRIGRRQLLKGTGAAALGGAALAAGPLTAWASDDEESPTILRFSTMAGIHAPFLGAASVPAFRGVAGGGAPWIIREGSGSLKSNGRLRVRVRGLVLDPAFVPPPLGGTNPIGTFVAIISVLSADSSINPVTLITPAFPASKDGDSDIAATLTLPRPLYAPIAFVGFLPATTPSAPRWFAVTGTP